ncbi:MAG TPA: hypothetical protein VL461_07425 [Dictyobacter sp.]|jgi:hypothetical protein|nr:hypothetical protein [Dictyobacter sp.]
MAHQDPKQEIINKLTRFLLPKTNKILAGMNEPEEMQRTLRFLKERALEDRITYFVLFEDEKGQKQHYTCYVVKDIRGNWQFRGAAGGGISGQVGPVVQQAWANLDGGGIPDHFHAGGYVADHGQNVTRIRLIAKNGTTIEDTVDENGVVLFLTDQRVDLPIQAELYNRRQELVYSHTVLG